MSPPLSKGKSWVGVCACGSAINTSRMAEIKSLTIGEQDLREKAGRDRGPRDRTRTQIGLYTSMEEWAINPIEVVSSSVLAL